MISIEGIFEMMEMYRKGLSISDIARQTGHDRKTVRKAVSGSVSRAKQPRKAGKQRERKIDAYDGYLKQRMSEGVYNTRKLLRELRERGYRGGLTQVILYVQPHRPKHVEPAVMRFETAPGQQCQVDWGSFGSIDYEGRQRNLYVFVMTLCWSRTLYVEFTVNGNTDWFIRCHHHAFAYLGGVSQEVLHDNLKSAVIYRDRQGHIHWNERYLDFATNLGFRPRACQPYRAQTKGKVERAIGYVRQNFWCGLHFTDLADLNRQALEWINTVANVRVHGTTGEVPFARLPYETLQPFDQQRFDTSIKTERCASRDCLVSYDGNFYSVPVACAQKMVLIKETEDRQLILYNALGEVVAHHPKQPGRYQRVVIPEHYAGLPRPARQQLPARAIQDSAENAQGHTLLPLVEQRPLSVYDDYGWVSHD